MKRPQEYKDQSLHSPKITALTWNITEKGKVEGNLLGNQALQFSNQC